MLPTKKETNRQGLRPVEVQVLKAGRACLTAPEALISRRPVHAITRGTAGSDAEEYAPPGRNPLHFPRMIIML